MEILPVLTQSINLIWTALPLSVAALLAHHFAIVQASLGDVGIVCVWLRLSSNGSPNCFFRAESYKCSLQKDRKPWQGPGGFSALFWLYWMGIAIASKGLFASLLTSRRGMFLDIAASSPGLHALYLQLTESLEENCYQNCQATYAASLRQDDFCIQCHDMHKAMSLAKAGSTASKQ